MSNSTSTTEHTSSWRYWIAGCLALTAITLCLASYLNKPTESLFTDAGSAQLHRAAWLAMGAFVCLSLAGAITAYEMSRRHAARIEARSPIARQDYIDHLQAMLLQARLDHRHPVRAKDVQRLLELIRPNGSPDTTPLAKGE